MKKLFTCLLLVAVMVAFGSFALANEAPEITVEVDGVEVNFPDAVPVIIDGRTLTPLSAIAAALDMEVEWDAEARQATFTKTYDPGNTRDATELSYLGRDVIVFTIGSATATHTEYWYTRPVHPIAEIDPEEDEDVDEDEDEAVEEDEDEELVETNFYRTETINMDTAAIIIEGRTMAPVRYLAETVGFVVDWDQATRTVTVDTGAEVTPATPVTVNVNGELVADATTHSAAGSIFPTHVSLLAVLAALDVEATVEDGEVTLEGLDGEITFEVGSAEFTVDEETVTLPATAVEVDGTIYVPLRFFTEVFGLNNSYFEGGTVFINDDEEML